MTSRPDSHALARPARSVALLAGLVFGLLTVLFSQQVRDVEAMVLRFVLDTPWSTALRDRTTVYLDLGSPHAVGVDVTTECTVGILILPLVLAYCVMVSFSGVRVRSALTGLSVGFLVVAVANELRLVSILVAWHRWGRGGLWISHILVGSIVSLVAVVAALGLQLKSSMRHGRLVTRSY